MLSLQNGADSSHIEIEASIGTCDSAELNRPNCAEYVYAGMYASYLYLTGQPPTLWDLLAITYRGEMGTYRTFYARNTQQAQDTLEAFARNFLDPQSGGCRFVSMSNAYDCNFENLTHWLSTVQSWYQTGSNNSSTGNAIVDFDELLNIDDSFARIREALLLSENWRTEVQYPVDVLNFFSFEQEVRNAFSPEMLSNPNDPWGTGQSGDQPSRWGNQELQPPGTTSFPPNPEHFVVLIVHIFPAGTSPRYGFNQDNMRGSVVPTCTYVAVITSSEGGLATLSSC